MVFGNALFIKSTEFVSSFYIYKQNTFPTLITHANIPYIRTIITITCTRTRIKTIPKPNKTEASSSEHLTWLSSQRAFHVQNIRSWLKAVFCDTSKALTEQTLSNKRQLFRTNDAKLFAWPLKMRTALGVCVCKFFSGFSNKVFRFICGFCDEIVRVLIEFVIKKIQYLEKLLMNSLIQSIFY